MARALCVASHFTPSASGDISPSRRQGLEHKAIWDCHHAGLPAGSSKIPTERNQARFVGTNAAYHLVSQGLIP
jgi:hypothetical protein